MLQHYRLRLGDGTVLQVDQDGLSAWLDDAKAMVQAAGSQKWCPLREFVWELRAAVRYAARQEADARAALPPMPPPPRVREEETPSAPPPPPSEPAEIPTVDSLEPPLLGASSSVQVVADDPVAQPAGDTRGTSTSYDPGPVIRFKPLDDDEAPTYEVAEPGDDEDDAREVDEGIDEEARYDRLEGPLLDVLSALGSFLSVWLTRLDRQFLTADPMASPVRYTGKPATADDALPVIPLKPLEAEEPRPRAAPTLTRLRSVVSGWVDGLGRSFTRSTAPDRPQPSIPGKEPAPSRAASPAPPDPLKPPPHISELPVLRFADTHEPAEVADIFEAEDSEGFFPVAWLWTKRVALVTGLVAGGVYAFLTWEAWFPRAADLGQRMFAEIDSLVRSRDQAERQQHALLVATDQLPHLSPQTIRLVLSGSPTGVLDPPAVFRLAWEAADRGLMALTPGQAEELRALRAQLLDTLRPTERERILEYDRARAHRATFEFEDRRVLDLFARAARVLPEPSRQRLQALLERAVAAGLVPLTEVAPPDTATR